MPVVPVVLVVTVPWTLALVVGLEYVFAAAFAVGHFLLLGYVQRQRGNHMTRLLNCFPRRLTGKFEASSNAPPGPAAALIRHPLSLEFDRIGTAGLVLGPLVLAVAAIGFDAATAADEDSDEEDEDEQAFSRSDGSRAMFDAASSVTDSAKSIRRESCDATQPNCRLCPPDLPP